MFEKLKSTKGFTLIEVVIVLAIGALIILVVLQAVSSAQRNQRDQARRQEAGQIAGALEQYAANNQGIYPASETAAETAANQYVPELAGKYTFKAVGYVSAPTPLTPGTCGAVGSDTYDIHYTSSGGANRDFRVGVCLEGSGELATIR